MEISVLIYRLLEKAQNFLVPFSCVEISVQTFGFVIVESAGCKLHSKQWEVVASEMLRFSQFKGILICLSGIGVTSFSISLCSR